MKQLIYFLDFFCRPIVFGLASLLGWAHGTLKGTYETERIKHEVRSRRR